MREVGESAAHMNDDPGWIAVCQEVQLVNLPGRSELADGVGIGDFVSFDRQVLPHQFVHPRRNCTALVGGDPFSVALAVAEVAVQSEAKGVLDREGCFGEGIQSKNPAEESMADRSQRRAERDAGHGRNHIQRVSRGFGP